MTPRLSLSSRDIAFLLILTAVPVLGYQFGMGNQVEQFPIIERFRDPNFIVGDFYTDSAVQFGPRFYYSHLVSFLTKVAPLPVVIFVLTCVVNFGLALVTFLAVRLRLGATAAGAATAAALAVTNSSFALGLAGYLRFESFQPASIAIPLGLLGFLWLADAKRYAAAGAFFAASLSHPLIGLEVALIAYISCALADLVESEPFSKLLRYVPSGLLFCALFAAAWVLPSLSTEHVRMSSEEFFSIIPAFRSPHHYLGTTFPLSHYREVAAFVAAMALLAFQLRKGAGQSALGSRLIIATAVVLVMCAASLILVDSLHNRLATGAQIFRMLMVVKWAGFILFGAAAGRWLATGRPLPVAAPFLVLVATGEAQPYVMLWATLLVLAAERLKVGKLIEFVLAAGLVLVTIYLIMTIGAREEAVRAALGAIGIGLLYLTPLAVPAAAAVAVALTGALITFGLLNRSLQISHRGVFNPTYTWSDLKTDDADIARWVKANTPAGAVWITPPEFEAFRLIAARPVVVDFTSIPLQQGAMREWRKRIRAVYGDTPGGGFVAQAAMDRNYRSVTPEKMAQLSGAYDARFAVLDRETPWPGPILYENETYKAVSLEFRR